MKTVYPPALRKGDTIGVMAPASRVERKIVHLRRKDKLGPARIAGRVGVPASTIYAVLRREELNRLSWLESPRRALSPHRPAVPDRRRLPPGSGSRDIHGR